MELGRFSQSPLQAGTLPLPCTGKPWPPQLPLELSALGPKTLWEPVYELSLAQLRIWL